MSVLSVLGEGKGQEGASTADGAEDAASRARISQSAPERENPRSRRTSLGYERNQGTAQ